MNVIAKIALTASLTICEESGRIEEKSKWLGDKKYVLEKKINEK